MIGDMGIQDRALLEHLQMDANLTLEKAKKWSNREAVHEHQGIMDQSKGKSTSIVDLVKTRNTKARRGQQKTQTRGHQDSAKMSSDQFSRCGRGSHTAPQEMQFVISAGKEATFSAQCFSKSKAVAACTSPTMKSFMIQPSLTQSARDKAVPGLSS